MWQPRQLFTGILRTLVCCHQKTKNVKNSEVTKNLHSNHTQLPSSGPHWKNGLDESMFSRKQIFTRLEINNHQLFMPLLTRTLRNFFHVIRPFTVLQIFAISSRHRFLVF